MVPDEAGGRTRGAGSTGAVLRSANSRLSEASLSSGSEVDLRERVSTTSSSSWKNRALGSAEADEREDPPSAKSRLKAAILESRGEPIRDRVVGVRPLDESRGVRELPDEPDRGLSVSSWARWSLRSVKLFLPVKIFSSNGSGGWRRISSSPKMAANSASAGAEPDEGRLTLDELPSLRAGVPRELKGMC